jgi:DNA-directed RNA polymerase subunit beta
MSNLLTSPNYLLPDLVQIQRDSFRWFLEEGLIEELLSFSPITDYTGKMELHFLPEYKLKEPKYSVDEAKRRDSTYSVQMYVSTRLINKETGEIREQQVFIGELPLMTDRGTFIINGAERVIVNQIVRSPGVYYKQELDTNGRKTFNASLIPNRGAWLKFETDANDLVWVRIDKTRKLSAVVLLKALGLSDNEILDAFRNPHYFQKTVEKEGNYTEEDALLELYRKLRPGEPPTVSGGMQLLESRFFDPKRYDLGRVGRYKLNKKLRLNVPDTTRTLTPQDILASIDYLINLEFDLGTADDIDHLGNRRVRSVGELLQNQVRVGLNRLERIIRERMTVSESETLTPASLVNPKPLVAAIKEFFGSSQLSQFMDQTNPLAELTHKRRLSALGPGGLTRERAGFAVRDIHPSHYGRICPIETPEGPNAGLIGSLATHARVNSYGFIETPYKVVEKGCLTGEIRHLTADEEDEFRVAAGDVAVDEQGNILASPVTIRYRQEFGLAVPTEVDFVAVSPIQIVSVATSLIPFLEHDDANRALMGANMQRQAVPLLHPERPLVGTGLEGQAARDSGMVIVADAAGEIVYVSGEVIKLRSNDGHEYTYPVQKYQRSNQDTCLNQRPIVNAGDHVREGQILADGSATEGGELALGQNILVAFMPWEGYNYEDAILISERLVYDDIFTSIHIEKFEIEARQTKLGPEEITREIPNVGEDSLKNLDERGIVRIGAWTEAGDILVGKVTPKGESDQPPEEKLLRAIFGEKARDVRDNSLRVPNGEKGRVVDVRVFTREQGDELPPGANMVVRVYVAQKRKIQVGDKVAGRHGNKGIVSKIAPKEDMPYLPDGRPVDIVLNPLGVPSRMNVGQVFETLMGWAGDCLNVRFKITPFDEMYGKEASRELVRDKLMEAREVTGDDWVYTDKGKHIGKIQVFDGRTGEPFDRPVTVGQIYMMKLVHLVDDKIHARSTGPYSLVTQQPLGGKAQQGGQRFGEMEVWALEAFGAAYTLQELLTVKSDDMTGRNEALNAIVKGKAIPRPGIPESFKVLVRELQSLGLDVSVHKIETQHDGSSRDAEVDLMADVGGRRTPSRPTYENLGGPREMELSPDD